MPSVKHIKKAQKDYPEHNIKKGDSYYQWKFRFGGLHRSLTYPKRQQLTQSDFYIQLYDIEDMIDALSADETLEDELQSVISSIQELADVCQERHDNMPEGLQQGSVGELLAERQSELESWMSNLESIDVDVDEESIKEECKSENDEWDKLSDSEKEELIKEKKNERYAEILEEIQSNSHSL